jgi:hypothetical protein
MTEGQIFMLVRFHRHLSRSRKVVVNTKKFNTTLNISLERRHVSLRYEKHQKFDLILGGKNHFGHSLYLTSPQLTV